MQDTVIVFNYLLDFIISFIENYLIISIVNIFFIKKFKTNFIIAILFSIASLIINKITYPPILSSIALLFLLYLYVFFFLEGNNKLKLSIPILVFANIFIVNSVTSFFLLLFNVEANKFIATLSIEYFCLSIFQKIILALEYLYLSKVHKNYMYISNNTWIYIIFLLFLSMIFPLFILSNYISKDFQNKYILFLSLFQFVVLNIFVYIVFTQLNKEHNTILEKQILVETKKHEQKINEMIEEKIDKMNRLNHDINHHKIVLENLVKNNQNDKAKQYIEDLFSINQNYIFTDNQVINYILNEKFKLANELGIDTKCLIQGNLKNSIPITDLTIVIGNLLDNAIEASYHSEEKYLSVNITQDKHKLIIQVFNSFNGNIKKQNEKILSIKKDKSKHGYGLSNIKLICQKYNGMSMIEYDNKIFKHTCTLLLNNGDIILSGKKQGI